MRGRTRTMAVMASLSALSLIAAGCGSSSDTGSGTGTTAGIAGGSIVVNGCTPQNPLIPGNTAEVCGGDILNATTALLVHYNDDTGAPENDIADSITSTDNQHFTVKLKSGYLFSNGTEVKAENFVKAWNYTAYCKNGWQGNYFFTPFEGYSDLNTDDGACKTTPKTKELSGLKVVDDHTFTITTTEKVSNLPVRLGYSAFAPLPDSFFESGGETAQGKMPIGAGPFTVSENSTTQIVVKKNPTYSGAYKANVDQITFRIYSDVSAAYNDLLANNLDVINQIPPDRLLGDAYQAELSNRTLSKPSGGNTWIGFSSSDTQINDNKNLRIAISKAIDRDQIIKQIFNNTVQKADGWVPPTINGYKANVCGDACVFDAAKAKSMFTAAGGYNGTLTMTYNADGAINKSYSEAVANSVKNTLGINVVAVPVPDFATFLKDLDAKSIKGMFRQGWQLDYPSIEDFLAPIYGKGSSSNYVEYDSDQFNSLLSQAASAPTVDQANALYQQAEEQLASDFPTAPLWNTAVQFGWSTNVTNVKVNSFGVLDFSAVKHT